MKIRKATEKDLESLNELQIALAKYETKFCDILKDPETVGEQYFKHYEEKIKREDCAFFVAEENTRIIGYILGETDTPEHHYIYEKRGYLADIFVLEKYRGRGIGEELTKRLLEWFKARGMRWIIVGAYTDNVPAIKFWKKMGFKDYVIVMTHSM